jgi:hypothetical protein
MDENKIDILREIYDGNMTDEAADDLYENLFKKYHQGMLSMTVEKFLCFSRSEQTALVMYGIPYSVLARWRYEGWPNVCRICGKSMNIEDGGWRARRVFHFKGKDYLNEVFHWDCYSTLRKDENNRVV